MSGNNGNHGTRGGIPARRWADPQPCGTPAAYRRHLRHKEKACWSCVQAERRRQADRRKRYGRKSRSRTSRDLAA